MKKMHQNDSIKNINLLIRNLKQIIDGRIINSEKAKTILLDALKEEDAIEKLQQEINFLIISAENFLVYGKKKRPGRVQALYR